jgi:hypothetical protein
LTSDKECSICGAYPPFVHDAECWRKDDKTREQRCKHPWRDIIVDTQYVFNCPAEGIYDEERPGMRCGACGVWVVKGTVNVLCELNARIRELARGTPKEGDCFSADETQAAPNA